MSEGITLKRIIDMDEAAELTSSDYALVDSATGGPKKFALGDELSSLKENLSSKANIDGYYEDMTVGNAEQLVSTMSVEDKVPYLFRTTGGSADVGNRAYIDAIVGGSVAWNQLVQNGNFADTSGWNTNGSASLSAENNVLTVTMNENATTSTYIANPSIKRSVLNHVYMYGFSVKPSRQTKVWMSYSAKFGNTRGHVCSANQWADCAGVIKSLADGTAISIYISDPATILQGDTLSFKNYNIFDLTQMFGSTIADYIYSLEQATAGAGVAWFRKHFPKPYYAYNTGELKHVSGLVSHDTVGFNQWDEEWENGSIADATGADASNSNYRRSANYIPVLPSTAYYVMFTVSRYTSLKFYAYDADKNFLSILGTWSASEPLTTPEGCYYLRFRCPTAVTYNNDICINLSWSGYRNGEYEAYVKHSYALDSDLVLRGIPKLDAQNNLYYDGDTYEPDGTVTRRYGVVDLGTLTWDYISASGHKRFRAIISAKGASDSQIPNIITNAYVTEAYINVFNNVTDKRISLETDGGKVVVYDTAYTDAAAFKTAMSGVYLVYELATPTTETADAYTSPQIVNDFGTEEYVTTSIIPVGHDTRYPANLRDKLQHLPDLADNDGTYLITQVDKQMSLTPYSAPTGLPTAPTTDGTYTLKATVSGGTPTYTWEAQT